MTPKPADLIPIPPERRWHEFRVTLLPAMVFVVVLGFVAVLWNKQIAAPSVVGEVESIRANVISTQPGLLAELNVQRFEKVAKGQLLGRLLPSDPELIKASLAVIDMDLRVLRARMAQDQQRNDLNYQQLRLDVLNHRVALAVAQANLLLAENEMNRVKQLFEEKVASSLEYDIAVRNLQRSRAEVEERTRLVTVMDESLQGVFNPIGVGNPQGAVDPIAAAIEAQEAKLLLLQGPMDLRAPMDGVVSQISRRAGEKVMGGEALMTVSAEKTEHIIGFIRQPLRMVPNVGDPVQVRTRSNPRQVASGKVLRVGAELQSVTSPLRIRGFDNSQERGLPILVSLPPDLQVYPGELVDLILRP